MKRLIIILLALSATACREETKSRKDTSALPSRRASPPANPPAAASGVPEPLLNTPRIIVNRRGGVGFAIIPNAGQAEAMLADIRTLPPSAARDRAIGTVIASLAGVDPAQARALLEAWNDGLISSWLDAAQKVLRQLAKSDPETAARFIEQSVPAAARAGMWSSFLADLAPEAQLPYFDRIPESSEKLTIAANLLLVWVAENPVACAAWLDEFAVGLTKDELQTIGTPRRYGANPNRKIEPRLAAFRAAKTQEARSIFAEDAWQKADPSERAGLISELQEAIPETVASEWESVVRKDPAAYAARLTPEQIAAFSRDDMRKLIEYWAEDHPEAAIQWAMEHGRPEAASALGRLHSLEPKKAVALALAGKLPPGGDRDQAISSLCQTIATRDAESAKAMLPLISDPQMREGTRKMVEKDWD